MAKFMTWLFLETSRPAQMGLSGAALLALFMCGCMENSQFGQSRPGSKRVPPEVSTSTVSTGEGEGDGEGEGIQAQAPTQPQSESQPIDSDAGTADEDPEVIEPKSDVDVGIKDPPKTPYLDSTQLLFFFDARQESGSTLEDSDPLNPRNKVYALTYGGNSQTPGEFSRGMIMSKDFYEQLPIEISLELKVTQHGNQCGGRGDGIYLGIALDHLPDLNRTVGGGRLGITGINTYGFEFDTFRNSLSGHGVPDDPNSNHISFDTVTADGNMKYVKIWDKPSPIGVDDWRKIRVRITKNKATFSYGGSDKGSIDIPADYQGRSGHFYVSASVGCSRAKYLIRDLRYANE